MNTSNSTNTVEMNFFKSLARLLSSSFRNKPFKFCTNVFLFVLSVGVLIVIRTGNSFIPSLLSNETNQFINLCLDFASAFYVVGLIFYLYWKVSPIKKDLILSGVITFIIIGSITLALWLIPVYNGLRYLVLSQMELTLDEFGSFFASITGLLAFLAVLYTANIADKRAEETITLAQKEAESNRDRAVKAEEDTRLQAEEARQRYREDSERTIFFQLLDLHTKKVDSFAFYKSEGLSIEAYQAFKVYIETADSVLNMYIILKHIIDIDNTIPNTLTPNECCVLKILYDYNSINTNELEQLQASIRGDLSNYDIVSIDYAYIYELLDDCYKQIIEKKDIDFIYDSFQFVAAVMYKKYGHILGHYFRNMYYVMDTINTFSDKKNYKEVFRAQLSRYELSLGLFNAVGNNSSIKMVELLEEFDVFKDIYTEDLLLFKTVKMAGIEPNILIKDMLDKYKENINTQSATL